MKYNAVQKKVAKMWSTVAPVGGINDQEPLAAMGPQYAIEMLNWFPGNNALEARRGYREWATNLGNIPVKSILSYQNASGDGAVFACTDGGIYDVTTSTDAPIIAQAVTNGNYKGVTFGTVAGQFLVAVNGQGSPALIYDGTDWTEMSQTTPAPFIGEIDGIDPKLWSQVTVFKRRLWFVEADSTNAWYMEADSISGLAKPFYLGSIFRRGGKLSYIIDWSVDASDGLDDKLVFVSNLGEIAIYAGDDPESADNWALEALFYSASPMGERTYTDVGGDVMFLTSFGVLQLSAILEGQFAQTPEEASVSKNVNRTLNRIATSRQYAVNWQIYNLAGAQAILVNIPPNGEFPAIQFVMNLLTGAWSRYDLPIVSAGFLKGLMYFGTADGRVCAFGEYIYRDNVLLDGTGGDQIVCEMATAFSPMDNPLLLKNWKLLRPLFQSDGPPNYVFRLNTDYSLEPLAAVPAPPPPSTIAPSVWGTAIWDESRWAKTDAVYRPWLGIGGMGVAASLVMKCGTVSRLRLVGLEYVYEDGGIV